MYELVKYTLHSKLSYILIILFLVYCYFKLVIYSYWKKHGIPHGETIVPLGSLNKEFFFKKTSLGDALKKDYEKFKSYPYHGLYVFHAPILMINDLQLIKQILIKDFSIFVDRVSYSNAEIDPMTENLFFLRGDKWRIMRMKLSPTFTSGKLKQMFPLLKDISNELINAVDASLESSDILQLKDVAQRFTIDTIFSLAFGVDSNTLKNADSPFRYYAELSVKIPTLKGALTFFTPNLMNKLRLSPLNPEAMKFLTTLFLDMIKQRRSERTRRNDFLNLLIELIDNEQVFDDARVDSSVPNNVHTDKVKKKLGPLEAAAQALAFFVAGHETTSSLISHCLYELALNPEVQEKLQDEIDNHLRIFKEIDYENINNLEYLDMVMYETLRKHPALPFLSRTCARDYKIPNTDYVIPQGMQVFISVYGINFNPDFYPDPEKFDPMRFSKEIAATRDQFAFLGFGEGPRNCIGRRLGIIQFKVGLLALLLKHKYSICEKTRIPNEYTTETIVLAPKDGIYLRVEKRKVD